MEGVDPEHVKRVVYEASKVGAAPPRGAPSCLAAAHPPLSACKQALSCILTLLPPCRCRCPTNPRQGTPHYQNEQRKVAQTDARIARMRAALAATPAAALAAAEQRMDARLAELEAGRDLTRTWCACGLGGGCLEGQGVQFMAMRVRRTSFCRSAASRSCPPFHSIPSHPPPAGCTSTWTPSSPRWRSWTARSW